MKIKNGLVTRKINDFYAVVPVDKKHIDFNGMMTLNHSGKLLYDALKEDVSKQDLVKLLCDTYEIDDMQARKDVDIFIEKLEKHHLLEK